MKLEQGAIERRCVNPKELQKTSRWTEVQSSSNDEKEGTIYTTDRKIKNKMRNTLSLWPSQFISIQNQSETLVKEHAR